MKLSVDPRLKMWYVAFTDNTNYQFWFSPLLRKGFAHCYAFTFDAEAQRWIRHQDIILQVKITNKPFVMRHFQNCASIIGNLLGINLFIPTPYRLFCALKSAGGQFSFLSSIKMEKESHG